MESYIKGANEYSYKTNIEVGKIIDGIKKDKKLNGTSISVVGGAGNRTSFSITQYLKQNVLRNLKLI